MVFDDVATALSAWQVVSIVSIVSILFCGRQVSYGVPLVAGCEPCPTDSVEECPRPEAAAHYGNYVGFNCHEPATYNPLATLFLNTQVR